MINIKKFLLLFITITFYTTPLTYGFISSDPNFFIDIDNSKIEEEIRLDLIRKAKKNIKMIIYEHKRNKHYDHSSLEDPSYNSEDCVSRAIEKELIQAKETHPELKIKTITSWGARIWNEGFLSALKPSSELSTQFKKAGIEHLESGGLMAILKGWSFLSANHEKIIIIDDEIVYLTDRGYAESYRTWHGGAQLITDPTLVKNASAIFDTTWDTQKELNTCSYYETAKRYIQAYLYSPDNNNSHNDSKKEPHCTHHEQHNSPASPPPMHHLSSQVWPSEISVDLNELDDEASRPSISTSPPSPPSPPSPLSRKEILTWIDSAFNSHSPRLQHNAAEQSIPGDSQDLEVQWIHHNLFQPNPKSFLYYLPSVYNYFANPDDPIADRMIQLIQGANEAYFYAQIVAPIPSIKNALLDRLKKGNFKLYIFTNSKKSHKQAHGLEPYGWYANLSDMLDLVKAGAYIYVNSDKNSVPETTSTFVHKKEAIIETKQHNHVFNGSYNILSTASHYSTSEVMLERKIKKDSAHDNFVKTKKEQFLKLTQEKTPITIKELEEAKKEIPSTFIGFFQGLVKAGY